MNGMSKWPPRGSGTSQAANAKKFDQTTASPENATDIVGPYGKRKPMKTNNFTNKPVGRD